MLNLINKQFNSDKCQTLFPYWESEFSYAQLNRILDLNKYKE